MRWVPIFASYMKTLRLREAKLISLGHTASDGRGGGSGRKGDSVPYLVWAIPQHEFFALHLMWENAISTQ